jgi:hypothetical protein
VSDEPLYCPFCGLEYCDCPYWDDGDERPIVYCELCGVGLPELNGQCPECDASSPAQP